MISPGPFDSYPDVENPLGVAAFDGILVGRPRRPGAGRRAGAGGAHGGGPRGALPPLPGGGAPAAEVARLRRGRARVRGRHRARRRGGRAADAPGQRRSGPSSPSPASSACPAAVAVAMLRHGLYDVDLVINRSLVWAVLSGARGGGVRGRRHRIGAVVQDASSTSASLVATVVVALLALPLRDRVQAAVNRLHVRRAAGPVQRAGRTGAAARRDAASPTACCRPRSTRSRLALQPAVRGDRARQRGRARARGGARRRGRRASRRCRSRYQGEDGRAARCSAPRPRRRAAATRAWCADVRCATLAAAALAVRRTDDLQALPRAHRGRARGGAPPAAARPARRPRPGARRHRLQLGGRPRRCSRPGRRRPRALAEVCRGDASATVADVRRLVNGLRPPALDELGLPARIREQAAPVAVRRRAAARRRGRPRYGDLRGCRRRSRSPPTASRRRR